MVSERLAELERALGARLLQRTTRKMSVTEDGLAFLARGRAHRARRDRSGGGDRRAARRPRRSAAGLSAPVSFGNLHLGSALYPFLGQIPGIELTLELDDRFRRCRQPTATMP